MLVSKHMSMKNGKKVELCQKHAQLNRCTLCVIQYNMYSMTLDIILSKKFKNVNALTHQ
jgi:hypothetical protein